MKIRYLIILCITVILAGCTAGVPYIAPMQLSAPQHEIVGIISDMGQEILLFDYSVGDAFANMEVWGEVLRYGEWFGSMGGHFMYNFEGFGVGRLGIFIRHCRFADEFQYIIYAEGKAVLSPVLSHDSEIMSRMYGILDETVQIIDGQDIILYISKFQTGHEALVINDFQYLVQNPEAFEGYTYVHLIKVRFSRSG